MSEIHAVLFWTLCAGVFVAWYKVGSQAALLFMSGRGVRPGRASRPVAGLLVALYAVAVYAALAALLGCPYLEPWTDNGGAGIVAGSPVVILVLAVAAKVRPVIAGLGRGEPAVIVVAAELTEPSGEIAFAEAEPVQAEEVAETEPEPTPPPPAFDLGGDLTDRWAAIDARLRRARG